MLEGDPRLLQQVGLDVAAGQLALHVEVDADELALQRDSIVKSTVSDEKKPFFWQQVEVDMEKKIHIW